MYIDDKKWGQVRLGLTGTPIYNITKDTNVTELEDTMHSDDRMNHGLLPASERRQYREGSVDSEMVGHFALLWFEQCLRLLDAAQRRGLLDAELGGLQRLMGLVRGRYLGRRPSLSEGMGREPGRSAAVFGYENYRDENIQNSGGGLAGFKRDINEWAGSGSIKHKPTGLFFVGAFSHSENNDSNRQNAGIFDHTDSPEMNAYDLQIGIQRKFIELGELLVLRRLQQYQRRHRRRLRSDASVQGRDVRDRRNSNRDYRGQCRPLVSRLRSGDRCSGHSAPLCRLPALHRRRRPDSTQNSPKLRRRLTISNCSTPAHVWIFSDLLSSPGESRGAFGAPPDSRPDSCP